MSIWTGGVEHGITYLGAGFDFGAGFVVGAAFIFGGLPRLGLHASLLVVKTIEFSATYLGGSTFRSVSSSASSRPSPFPAGTDVSDTSWVALSWTVRSCVEKKGDDLLDHICSLAVVCV